MDNNLHEECVKYMQKSKLISLYLAKKEYSRFLTESKLLNNELIQLIKEYPNTFNAYLIACTVSMTNNEEMAKISEETGDWRYALEALCCCSEILENTVGPLGSNPEKEKPIQLLIFKVRDMIGICCTLSNLNNVHTLSLTQEIMPALVQVCSNLYSKALEYHQFLEVCEQIRELYKRLFKEQYASLLIPQIRLSIEQMEYFFKKVSDITREKISLLSELQTLS